MPNSLYEWVWVFLIYAFAGWCCEVMFVAVNEGHFVNRGFLAGPVCPIYGCGVSLIVLCLSPVQGNLLLLFVGSVLLTSLIEFVTGFVLEKIFHQKWWDYSDLPFQLGGYVCLRFSLLWGVACVAALRLVHPLVMKLIRWVHPLAGHILLAVALVVLVVGMGVTVAALLKIKKQFRLLDEMEARIREVAEGLGKNLAAGATASASAAAKARAYSREELEELKARRAQREQERDKRAARFYRAFPDLQRLKDTDLTRKLRERREARRKNK